MTLKEMAACYRTNIIPWQARAAALRKEIAACGDTQQRLMLEQRLRMVVRICREGKALAHIMDTYYDETRRENDVPTETARTAADLPKQ